MWANAQHDGRPAEYRWRPLLNAAVWLTSTTRVLCSNAAKTRNLLKLPGVPQTNEMISAASGPKFAILSGHVEEVLLLNKFFPIVDTCLSCEDMARQSCAMVPRWRFLATFLWSPYVIGRPYIFSCCGLFMVALWNRETIYIFILFLLSSFFFFLA